MWNNLIEVVTKVNSFVNDIVWGWPVIILILTTGIFLTVRLRFFQVRKFKDSLNTTIVPTVKELGRRKQKKGDTINSISQFEAFSAAISGTVGTGNIIGVAAAILTGGPGAVFWMWFSAFFGMVTNYAENVLGLYYRKKEKNGDLSGGPMYYIAYGLRWKWLAYCAAIFCMLAAIGMSGAQTNKISGTLAETVSILTNVQNMIVVKFIIGVVVAGLSAAILLGGIKRIGKVASKLVPLMTVVFIIFSITAVIMHFEAIPQAFVDIFSSAFRFKAVGGGILGYSFATIIRKGMARGVFSNEAGLGSSVIAHSASDTREPVKQGLWGVFEVFFDTFVVCTLSALMMLTTFDASLLTGTESDTAMAMQMFSSNFGIVGVIAFSLILPLFAFTTIIAWSYYGEKATLFLFGFLGEKGRNVAVVVFKVVYVLLIVASALIESELAWAISDTFNGLMAIPNLICLIALSGLVCKITKNYYARKKGEQVEPMLSAYSDLNEEFKKDLEEGRG